MKTRGRTIVFQGGKYFKENPQKLKGLFGKDLKWFDHGFTPLIKLIELNDEKTEVSIEFCLIGTASVRSKVHRLIPIDILSKDYGMIDLRYFLEICAKSWKFDLPNGKILDFNNAEFNIVRYDGLYEFRIPVN